MTKGRIVDPSRRRGDRGGHGGSEVELDAVGPSNGDAVPMPCRAGVDRGGACRFRADVASRATPRGGERV